MLAWPFSSCRYMTSRKVRCASVALRNASKHFLSATTCRVFLSIAFQTIPYALVDAKSVNTSAVSLTTRNHTTNNII